MTTYTYKTKGVCSRSIDISVEDGIIKDIKFEGGCNGNLKGIAALSVGHSIKEVADRVKGIHCGMKSTSCPDQLAIALEKIMAEEA